MRPLSALLACCAVAVLGCAKSDTNTADTAAAATPAPPPAPAPIKLSDVAGTWTVAAKNEAGDSTLVTYEFTATADTTGWQIKFPNMAKPVPVKVTSMGGDSIVIQTGKFPSQLRKGVTVQTNGVLRIQDGKLTGSTTAHYSVKTADSVRTLRTEGTRKQ